MRETFPEPRSRNDLEPSTADLWSYDLFRILAGLGKWILLFLFLVFLPVRQAKEFFLRASEERLELFRETVTRENLRRTPPLIDAVHPTYCLQPFLTRNLGLDPAGRGRFLSRMGNLFPGSLQVAAWDLAGNPVPVASSVAFSGVPFLERIVRGYLMHGGAIGPDLIREDLKGMRNLADIQDFLSFVGTNVYGWPVLQEVNKEIFPSGRKQGCMFLWSSRRDGRTVLGNGGGPRAGSGAASDSWDGFFLKATFSRFPKDFFPRLALKGVSRLSPEGIENLILLDLANPRRSVFHCRSRLPISLAEMLAPVVRRRRGNTFFWGSWLVSVLPIELSKDRELILLTPVGKLRETERAFQAGIGTASKFLLLLGGIVLLLVALGNFRNIGLRWQVAGLLILASLLPIMGMYWAGTALEGELERKERNTVFGGFRTKTERLKERFRDFIPLFSARMVPTIRGTVDGSKNTGEALKALEAFQGNGKHWPFFTQFFLSDGEGKIERTSARRSQQNLVIFRILISRLFKDHVGVSESQSSVLAQAVVDDVQKIGKTIRVEFPLDSISSSRFGQGGEKFLLPMVVRVGNSSRVLLLTYDADLLISWFLRFELRKGWLAKDHRESKGSERIGFFRNYVFPPAPKDEVASGFPAFFDREVLKTMPDLYMGSTVKKETSGEVEIGGERFLFFFSNDSWLEGFRFLGFGRIRDLLEARGWRNLLFLVGMASVLLFVPVMGIVVTNRILEPVRRLDEGLARVCRGDLGVALPAEGDDEIGRLSRNFNLMVGELREKERLRAYLSETALQAIKAGNEAGFEAREKEVSVLVSDIRGFTTLSERYPVEELFSMLNGYFEVVEEVTRCNGGQVQKFIGDAVYAVFPEEGEKGVAGALATAASMLGFLEEFNARRAREGLFTIAIGVGIDTGRVLLGKIGSQDRSDLAFIGPPVNRSFLLETASKKGTHSHVIVSAETLRYVTGRVAVEPLPHGVTEALGVPERVFEIVEFPAPGRKEGKG